MKRRYMRIFWLVVLGLTLSALQTDAAEPQTKKTSAPVIVVGVPKAPPAFPLLRMLETNALGDEATIKLDVWTTPEQVIAMAQDGEHPLVALPLTVAAKLYNKGIAIRMINVNTWGVASLVTSDAGVAKWEDLAGKTLFVPLKSSTPDALTRYFLSRAGLRAGTDVNVVYAPVVEIARLLLAGKAENTVLIEPHVTAALSAKAGLREIVSFADEWQTIQGPASRIPNAGMAASGKLIAENPDLVRRFNEEYEKALAWTMENPEAAGSLAEKHLGLKADLIAAAMPGLGLLYKSGPDAGEEIAVFFQVLHDFSPELIGKDMPGEAFYWQ